MPGSRSREAQLRRRRRRRQLRRTRDHKPVVTDDLLGGTQPESEPSSQRGKREATPEQSEGERQKEMHARTPANSSSPGVTHAAEDSEAPSIVSPPLRFPREPKPDDFETKAEYYAALDDYDDVLLEYHEKRKRQLELVTLDPHMPSSSLVKPDLRSVRESTTETALQVAKVVFGLSSYADGKLLARTSGFLFRWDEESKTGTLLTSARIICSRYTPLSQWSGTDQYLPNSEVVVHLLDKDDTTVTAKLLHFDKQINMAVFMVGLESCGKVLEFNCDVKYSQQTFVIGRDENLNLTIDHDHVEFTGPTGFERPHHMFTGSGIRKSSVGGPAIDIKGKVLGMANYPGAAFIPSGIILWCLDMWEKEKYQSIPRLHMGIKFSCIKFLDPTHVERIFRKCNVDSGLIVKEVSNGSFAEKVGVRPGDIITSINGECIATNVELEKLTMKICKNHLDRGGTIGSWVDVPVHILHMGKGHEVRSRSTLSLRFNVSDDMEVFRE